MKDFVGFKNIIQGFGDRVENDKLSHAHLIIGAEGIGKSLIARIFALKILGKTIEKEYADIINYRPKKISFGVDEVRNIIEEVSKKPYEGDKKVIIIHKGDKLTIQAQNALLKTIEEPPKGVYIILLSESLELMLETIKSRCQIYKLTPLKRNEMEQYIGRLGNIQEDKRLVALAYSEGIPGRAERVLKDDKLSELRQLIIELLREINTKNKSIILEYEEKLGTYKEQKEEVLNLLISFIRDIVVYKELEDRDKIINIDKYNDIKILTEELSYKKLNSMLEYIKNTRIKFKNNVSYSMAISVMLIGFLEG